jgi:O-methyltransferase domain
MTSLYELFSGNADGALQFAAGMRVFGSLPQFHMDRIVEGYDWQALGKSKVVDVGGSEGHLCIALAQRYSDLTFVVQDMANVVEKGRANLPRELEGRVEFVAHDAFLPQKVDADVYLFRTVFHNWSDKFCSQILRALVPALKPGVKILINDMCLPRPGTIPAHVELDMR